MHLLLNVVILKVKLNKPTLIKHTSSSSKDYTKNKSNGNFKRAGSQISLINKHIKKKDYISPTKRNAIRRTKLKSRAKTGQTVKDPSTGLLLDASNSPSDEYYETTKISPTSSIANSVYSKGVPHAKSSQSCRNTAQEMQNTGNGLQINNL